MRPPSKPHQGGAAVIPAFLVLNVAIGASIALASRHMVESGRLWRSSALWALVALQALIEVPAMAYVAHRYPAWSFGYLLADEPPAAALAPLIGVFVLTAIAAFIVTRRLLAAGHLGLGIGVLAIGLAGTAFVVFARRDALRSVGGAAAFASDSTTLQPLQATALGYLVGGVTLLVLLAWGNTLWRLVLVSRASANKGHGPWKTVKRGPATMPLAKRK